MGGAGGGFEVHASALRAFAATSDQRQQAFEQCLARAAQLTVSPDAFGMIPGISARVHDAYQNHVQECAQGMAAAADAMASVSHGIKVTIGDYERANTSTEDHIAAVEWKLTFGR